MKEVWLKEFARLKGIIADLEGETEEQKKLLTDTLSDLREHKSALLESRQIHSQAVEEHAAEAEILAADLREHEDSLAEVNATLDQARVDNAAIENDLRSQIAEQERTKLGLESHLARSEASARTIQEELVEVERDLRGQIEEQEQTREALESALAGAEATAGTIQAELAASRGECEGLGAEIARLDATVTDLRTALRNRLQNLQRAFALKKPDF